MAAEAIPWSRSSLVSSMPGEALTPSNFSGVAKAASRRPATSKVAPAACAVGRRAEITARAAASYGTR